MVKREAIWAGFNDSRTLFDDEQKDGEGVEWQVGMQAPNREHETQSSNVRIPKPTSSQTTPALD